MYGKKSNVKITTEMFFVCPCLLPCHASESSYIMYKNSNIISISLYMCTEWRIVVVGWIFFFYLGNDRKVQYCVYSCTCVFLREYGAKEGVAKNFSQNKTNCAIDNNNGFELFFIRRILWWCGLPWLCGVVEWNFYQGCDVYFAFI